MPGPYCCSYWAWSWFIPMTWPENEFVARNESRPGISMSNDGVWSSSEKPPIWNSEKAAGSSVFHSASVAAIFIGCASVTTTPNSLPKISWMKDTGSTTMTARVAAPRNSPTFLPRLRCQQATPRTTNPPVSSPARMMCPHATSANSWKRISKMSFACARPVC